MKKSILIIIFSIISQNVGHSQTITEPLNSLGEKTSFDTKYSLQIAGGNESNPLSVADAVGSSFVQVSPRVKFESEIGDTFLILNVQGAVKSFQKEIVSNAGDSRQAQADLGVTQFFNAHHEVGATVSALVGQNNEIAYTAEGVDLDGRTVAYDNLYLDTYYGFNESQYSVFAKVISKRKQFNKGQFDELLNEQKKSYEELAGQLLLNLHPTSTAEIELVSGISRRVYSAETARNTEGSIDLTNPTLSELHRFLGAKAKIDLGGLELKAGADFTVEEDEVYNALDAQNISTQVGLSLQALPQLKVSLNANRSQKDYANFVQDPFDNPETSGLRKDQESGVSLELKFLDTLSMQYSEKKYETNYVGGEDYQNQSIQFNYLIQ